MALELGASPSFLYALKAREWLSRPLEEVSRRAPDHSSDALGGVAHDLPAGLEQQAARHACDAIAGADRRDRRRCSTATASSSTAWTASASSPPRDALDCGFTGPCLRATRRRLRRAQGAPVLGLRPLRLRRAGRHARRQLRPLRCCGSRRCSSRSASSSQALEQMPRRARSSSTTRASRCRPRREVYNTIEGVIAHFKLIMDGIQVPPGEVYAFTEARQRRARLLHRLRRQRPPVQVPRARAGLPHPLRRCRDDRRARCSRTWFRPSTRST